MPGEDDWCLVNGGQTMDAMPIREDATNMRPTPGSTAMQGGDPISRRVVIGQVRLNNFLLLSQSFPSHGRSS